MRRAPITVLACAALALAPSRALSQSATDKSIELADFLDIELVRHFFLGGTISLSPDGQKVLYTRVSPDKMADRWHAALWMMNVDGSKKRHLVDAWSASWSPDGSRIAYVKGVEGQGAEIFVRWMDDEGATTQITRLDRGPGSLAWSPDGQSIAFTMRVPSQPTLQAKLPARPAGAKWANDAKVVERLDYRRDYGGYTDDGRTHVFVVPASGGTARQLTDGDFDHSGPTWSHDGRSILFTSNRVPDAEHSWRESDIYAVDLATGSIRQLTRRHGPDYGPVVSPDGRWIAYLGYDWTDDTYITSKLYVMAPDGSGSREISGTLDRSPGNLIWAADGSGVYFSADHEGRSDLYLAPLDGQPRQLTRGDHHLTVSGLVGRTGVGLRHTPTDPGNVVAVDVTSGRVTPLTDLNGDVLAGKSLGTTEEINYRSVDDYRIQGWIIKPPNFDRSKKYPLMLAIHGGPHGMYSVATSYMWFEWQYYANQGYVILYTNPRGSSGYGSAFGNAIKNAYPGKDFDDLMAGVDTVIGRGYVDTDNMFVYGCSGGGVLTAWVVGHTDRFRAASSECPVTNWFSFVGTTDGSGWYRNFAKLPWEDPSEHLRRSPLMYVGNVKTPTMLMTGENDLRTPISQTEEYYAALKMQKVPTAMIRLQDEWHAYFFRPSNFMRALSFREQWFERYRRGERPIP